jgi:hypothetical protein
MYVCTYIQIAKGVDCRSDRPSLPSRLAYKVVKVMFFALQSVALWFGPQSTGMKSCLLCKAAG